ncbi:MAG TPA: biotin/lipoyl-binding protein [Desulfosporosinus sp.]|nr:biotin/lipoyl-binding protein [Desulfosporosinus sp.]
MEKKWLSTKWLSKKWLSKKWVTLGIVSVLVLGGGYWGYKHFTAKPVVAANLTAKAKLGDVRKVITATGTVNFPHSIPLQFSNNGQVVELNIKDGDSVKKGQVLARIDDADLKTAVVQQQANLMTAQAKLQSLQDGFNAQTRAEAQSALAKAQQGVATAQQNLTTAGQNAEPSYLNNQVALAKQNVKQASDDLAKAQQSSDTASSTALNQAMDDLTTAENAQNGGAAQALASAQAQYRSAQADVVSAQYALTKQMAGPTAADLQSAQASITQAQGQLDSANAKLAEATILAPTDAVVIDSGLQLYQYTTDDSKITITPSEGTGNSLEVAATIDQADIAQVKLGQTVDITLDAYPDEHSSGSVTLVALQGTTASNVTTFKVTVAVEKASDKLRSGMNANINIVVAEAKNVLTVPSEAIKTKGTIKSVLVPMTPGTTGAGQAARTRQSGTTPNSTTNTGSAKISVNSRSVPVEIGLDDGTNVEIKSGIKEGQEVITGTSSAAAVKAPSGFSLGGGGNRAGGGAAAPSGPR